MMIDTLLCRVQQLALAKVSMKCFRSTTQRAGMHSLSVASKRVIRGVDPFRYTSGRWLRGDRLNIAARHIEFDFDALCLKALSLCPEATEITKCEKKEGSFNRVFILCMDTGTKIVARIPFRVAGPARLTTHSEVATVTYIHRKTNIPVPKILDWNDDPNNPIGSEYIIMELASGVQLHERWPTMTMRQHMQCVKSIAMLVKEMALLQFPAYGSLYFADARFLEPASKVPLVDDFCIGPHCGAPVWPCAPAEVATAQDRLSRRGPWSDLQSFGSGLVDVGRAHLSTLPREESRPEFQGNLEEHAYLLDICEEVVNELVRSPALQHVAAPMLLHYDLNKRNIFVSDGDPTVVTGLIDWSSSCVEPAFVYNNERPDFTTPPDGPTPDGSTYGRTQEEQRLRVQKDVAICAQTFEVVFKGYAPLLAAAREIDETLLRVLRYCGTSWRNSATSLRQELIELSQRWTELSLPGNCPYQPSTDQLKNHARQFEDFETFQSVKSMVVRMVDSTSDGWVPPERFLQAQVINRRMYDQWIESAQESSDPDMPVSKAEKMWAFDVE